VRRLEVLTGAGRRRKCSDEDNWFVPNPLNKITASLRDNPTFNADGSLTLYLQNESPARDKEANWLPAPKGEFISMVRM
jgi:hypothetical protein